MKWYTEYIILYEDKPMPEVECFCPTLWKQEHIEFGKDNDYYYVNINDRWTNLELLCFDGPTRTQVKHALSIYTYREKHRPYDVNLWRVNELQRFVNFKNDNFTFDGLRVSQIEALAVTSLSVLTSELSVYEEYMNTTHQFLKYTGGYVVNTPQTSINSPFSRWDVLDATQFKKMFLEDEQEKNEG
ncbi:MAG: hypothetical protein EP343_20800 [Deltaproteobacteria bacterium]|nr:MAG: hypothetical protein EP343_20800 [Deltaproteobacteria bacterium]